MALHAFMHGQVRAWPAGKEGDSAVRFLTNSWVADGFGDRVFFTGAHAIEASGYAGTTPAKRLEQASVEHIQAGSQARRRCLIRHLPA